MLIVVGLTGRVVLGSLIIGHAARAMAVRVARDWVKEVGLARGLHSKVCSRNQGVRIGRSVTERWQTGLEVSGASVSSVSVAWW